MKGTAAGSPGALRYGAVAAAGEVAGVGVLDGALGGGPFMAARAGALLARGDAPAAGWADGGLVDGALAEC